jgi:glycosyltransferase involved in cell wall biosynthesis
LVLPQLPEVHEVILVDGDSRDDTVETARRLLPSIRVLSQTRRGKGNALAVGFEAATGDIIVMFDADGSADAREIPTFVDTLLAGADFAKGSRNMEAGGSDDITGIRHLGNQALVHATNVLFGTDYTDLCYGYNAFWRDILPALELPSAGDGPRRRSSDKLLWGDGFEIETLLNCRVAMANLDVVEAPSVELSRVHGESNLNARTDGIRVLRTLLKEWGRHSGASRRRRTKQSIRRTHSSRSPVEDLGAEKIYQYASGSAIPAPRSGPAGQSSASLVSVGRR